MSKCLDSFVKVSVKALAERYLCVCVCVLLTEPEVPEVPGAEQQNC